MAVKILKNIENRKQIQDFEREVDMLRLVIGMSLVVITVQCTVTEGKLVTPDLLLCFQ